MKTILQTLDFTKTTDKTPQKSQPINSYIYLGLKLYIIGVRMQLSLYASKHHITNFLLAGFAV